MTRSLRVIHPGLMTTVQDLGRWGWQSRGVPVAGAMDLAAHRIANALVGNPPESATLEITLAGPHLACDDDCRMAVTGAPFEIESDGRSVPMNAAVSLRRGAEIRFGRRERGARAYLAVDGGIVVPPVLGSRSTHVPSRLGGYHGRPLQRGDVLPVGPAFARAAAGKPSPLHSNPPRGLSPEPDSHRRLRILPAEGLQHLVPDALHVLTTSLFTVDPQSDRMGLRLNGGLLQHAGAHESISSATLLGAIQVPPSGQPIVLLADRQTTGGYPIVATIISADIGRAGQLAPGDAVAFAVCTRQEAIAALVALEQSLLAIESARA